MLHESWHSFIYNELDTEKLAKYNNLCKMITVFNHAVFVFGPKKFLKGGS